MSLDLQEQTISNDTYEKLNSLIAGLKEVPVGLPLVWLYVWDIVVAQYEQHSGPIQHGQEEAVPEGITLKTIWDKFWADAGKAGFTLEYGTQHLYEHVDDWLRDNDFLVCLDEDGWLE